MIEVNKAAMSMPDFVPVDSSSLLVSSPSCSIATSSSRWIAYTPSRSPKRVTPLMAGSSAFSMFSRISDIFRSLIKYAVEFSRQNPEDMRKTRTRRGVFPALQDNLERVCSLLDSAAARMFHTDHSA